MQKIGKERCPLGYHDDKELCDYDCMGMVHRILAAENRSRGKLDSDNSAVGEAGQRETDSMEAE